MAKLTEKAILNTFDTMIRELPFEKISVTALVARCEISSNTFYYHYADIYALLDEWLRRKLLGDIDQEQLSGSWKDALKEIVRRFQSNKIVVNHIFDSISRDRLERYLFQVVENNVKLLFQKRFEGQSVSSETIQMLSATFCYSIFGFLLKFMFDGMTADIDATFDPIIDFLEYSITSYVSKA